MEKNEKTEYEEVMSTYFGDDQVSAVINLKVDTKHADTIAEKVSEFRVVKDVLLVTGDTDIVVRVRFKTYDQLKRFLMENISPIEGINEIETSMVVTTFKESGELKFMPKEEE